ncbi:MAG: metallophosphoesterase, partial [Bdellovibrionales bacterium]
MDDTQAPHSWRNGRIPKNRRVYAIGDIHAHPELLQTLLDKIENETSNLPKGTKAEIVCLGDYIDRGPDGPGTLDVLLRFQKKLENSPNASIHFLGGNHEEFFSRLLKTPRIVDTEYDTSDKYGHLYSTGKGKIQLKGLEDFLFLGGGITTLRDYLKIDPDSNSLFDMNGRRFNAQAPNLLQNINALVRELQETVPESHKAFFRTAYKNEHKIIGDYLFIHAGIHPDKSLKKQGIGKNRKKLNRREKLAILNIRNEFLWAGREVFHDTPYVIVHGHT